MCPQVELLFGLPFCRQTSEELWHTPAPLDPALMRKQQRQANLKLLQEGYALDELPANKYEDEEYVSQTDDGGGGSTARTSDSGGGMDDTAGSRRRPPTAEAEERRKEMDAARDQEQELREQAQQADAGARQGFEDQLKEAEKNRREAESQVERVERDTRTNTILQAQGERGLQTSVEDARKEACIACKENSGDPRYCAPSCDEPREDGSSDGPST